MSKNKEEIEFYDEEQEQSREEMMKQAALLEELPVYSELSEAGDEEEFPVAPIIEDDLEIEIESAKQDEPEVDLDTVKEEDVSEEGDVQEQSEEEEEDIGHVDEDLAEYSKDIQKIVMDERRKAQSERLSIENQYKQQITQSQTQLQNSQVESDRAQYTALLAVEDTIKSDIKGLTSKLRAAKDEGDIDQEIEISGKIAGLQHRINKVVDSRAQFEDKYGKSEDGLITFPKLNEVPEQTEAYQQQEPTQDFVVTDQVISSLPQEAQSWYKNNQALLGDKIKDVLEIDNIVSSQLGKNPNSPEYYDAMNYLLEQKFQGLKFQPSRIPPEPPKKARPKAVRQSPVAPVKPQPQGKARGGNRVTLTTDDINNMRTFGLDPRNRKHQVAYAKSKLESS